MAVKAKQKNVWLLCGDDTVLVQEKKRELIRRYYRDGVPDTAVYDGPGSFPEYRAALEGQSLFSPDAAVVIENPFFLKKALKKEEEKSYDEFLDLLRQLPPEVFLVMTLEGKPDKRTKAVKRLLDFASLLECDYLRAADGAEYMEEYLYDRGKRLAPEGRAWLEEVLGTWSDISAPFLQTECDKILLALGPEKTVTKALLEASVTGYMNQMIFSFFDRLLARDAEAVLEGAPRVFTDQTAVLKNVGFLTSQFRRIKMWKELARQGVGRTEAAARLGLRGTWQIRQMEARARQVTEREAEDILLALFQWQYGQRAGAPAGELTDVLVRFCLSGRRG